MPLVIGGIRTLRIVGLFDFFDLVQIYPQIMDQPYDEYAADDDKGREDEGHAARCGSRAVRWVDELLRLR